MRLRRLAQVRRVVSEVECLDYTFDVTEGPKGICFLQLRYLEADIHTKAMATQRTRRWVIEPTDSTTKIVETCWAAVQRSMLHRAAESFKWLGQRVYSPHFHIDVRYNAARQGEFDGA